MAARDPLFFPEQGVSPHRPDTLLLFEADEPDHVEDVTGHAEAKLDALFAHESQFRSTMGIEPGDDGAQRGAFIELIRSRLAEHGALAGIAEGEAFKAIRRL